MISYKMVIAYLRVSTEKQHIGNQEEEIRKFADSKNLTINKWCKETVSGTKDQNGRALGGVLKRARKGDSIIVSEMSRLSRRMFDIIEVLNICMKKSITLYSVKEGYEIGDDINSKVMGFAFSLSAEIERNLISMRTKEALAQRKAQGVILGRPKGPSKQYKRLVRHRHKIKARLDNGEKIVHLAQEYQVARSTFYRFLNSFNTSCSNCEESTK